MSKVIGAHLRRKRPDELSDEFEQGSNWNAWPASSECAGNPPAGLALAVWGFGAMLRENLDLLAGVTHCRLRLFGPTWKIRFKRPLRRSGPPAADRPCVVPVQISSLCLRTKFHLWEARVYSTIT